MGGRASRPSRLRKAVRANSKEVTEVDLDGVELADGSVRKLTEALRKNR